ncbi:MAG: metal-dependent transcriptional regulator [candidate division NC10 bacterium]|nr:metal-dependent transcriptional regulator [candidate division NC10 bacterium]
MHLPHPAPPTDEVLEDCLQAIHRLEGQDGGAPLGEVAAFARITPATAREALQALQDRGLVLNDQPGSVSLTSEGRRQAAGVLRRHRLSERLFADVLGLPWDRVHDEAMRLEHALTPEAEARLATLLNHPETCPHGGPIPAADGSLTVPPTRPLDGVPAGTRVWIQQIIEEEATLLRYLASLGLLPRTELRVEEVAPFGGPLLVQVGDARYALGREVAAKILIRCSSEQGD